MTQLHRSRTLKQRGSRRNGPSDEARLLEDTARVLIKLSRLRPSLAVVLGTGFDHALAALTVQTRIRYVEIPGFPRVGVSGHRGEVVLGRLSGTPVLALCGRSHYYEGHSMAQVTFAVRALAVYGISDLLLTNAAGGINRKFRPGDFMVVTDHINFMGINPLRGAPESQGVHRFVDLTHTYDPKLSSLLRRAGKDCGLKLRSGVYLAVCGPSYETPAEIRAFQRLGADAVGMSTVPEAIVARQCGIRVAGLSCITNLAARKKGPGLSHQEVLDTSTGVKDDAARVLRAFAQLYSGPSENRIEKNRRTRNLEGDNAS
jgi:purine-nucleoside phosphorylase